VDRRGRPAQGTPAKRGKFDDRARVIYCVPISVDYDRNLLAGAHTPRRANARGGGGDSARGGESSRGGSQTSADANSGQGEAVQQRRATYQDAAHHYAAPTESRQQFYSAAQTYAVPNEGQQQCYDGVGVGLGGEGGFYATPTEAMQQLYAAGALVTNGATNADQDAAKTAAVYYSSIA
jgi:hypothetical protein